MSRSTKSVLSLGFSSLRLHATGNKSNNNNRNENQKETLLVDGCCGNCLSQHVKSFQQQIEILWYG